MVNNSSFNVTPSNGLSFDSKDTSASKMSDEKMGSEAQYFAQEEFEEEQERKSEPFVDRSAQLSATLNSLAALNLINIKHKEKKNVLKSDEKKQKHNKKETFLESVEEKEDDEDNEKNKNFNEQL